MSDADDPCAECGGKCCSFRLGRIHFSGLDDGERYDSHFLDGDYIDQLVFEDGTVPEMNWFVVTDADGDRNTAFECTHLTDDGRCGAYDKRPGMCRAFECPAVDPDDDTTLDEWLDDFARDGVPDDVDVRDVTDRVRSILKRRSDEEGWPTDDTHGFGGEPHRPHRDDDTE
jgi:Fe-S-cluster containining protein